MVQAGSFSSGGNLSGSLVLGLIYLGSQNAKLEHDVHELRDTTNTIVSALMARLKELEELLIECGITINRTAMKTGTVYLTKRATALEALRRIAVVKTTFYPGLGEYINSIDGLSEKLQNERVLDVVYLGERGLDFGTRGSSEL
jgi:hypothetical protein